MRAEVIAIGDELTSGQRLDTNSQWLSQQLALLGVPVSQHTTVGDDQEAMVAVLAAAIERSDIVVVSGGLGPTADDLTRQAIAQMSGRRLIQDDHWLDHIRALFQRRGRVMPERNVIQACFPEGSRPIPNPHGTAPGIHLTIERAGGVAVEFFALPGVPAELTEMWEATVSPAIAVRLGPDRRVIGQREIRCFGAGESEIESRLPDLVQRGRDPLVGITASQATITLRVTTQGASLAECHAKMAPTVATIYECLGPLIYGEGSTKLPDAVACLLADRGHSLATVEWGTAGLIVSWLGDVRGVSTCLRGGLVVRDFQTLHRLLGTEISAQRAPTPAPQELAVQMAMAVRDRFASDYGLAVGPFPQGEASNSPPAHVYLAVAGRAKTVYEPFTFAAHPAIQRSRCAKQALNLLRLSILERRA